MSIDTRPIDMNLEHGTAFPIQDGMRKKANQYSAIPSRNHALYSLPIPDILNLNDNCARSYTHHMHSKNLLALVLALLVNFVIDLIISVLLVHSSNTLPSVVYKAQAIRISI